MYKKRASPFSTEQVRVATLLKKMVTEEEALSLYASIKLEEIEETLKKLKMDKSQGPDGWSIEFISLKQLGGGDLLEMAEEARTRGKIVGGLKATFIALIPSSRGSMMP
jgi:hypothetical protein